MILIETELAGCYVVELERQEDERGFFARTFDEREFAKRGLTSSVAQCSVSYNAQAATLRGMHYQAEPFAEAKLVRCARGRAFDVAVDVRPDSPTLGGWVSAELSADNGLGLFISEGLAHGFVTLEPGTELVYQISVAYRPEAFRGFRWDDPDVGVGWPIGPVCIGRRDAELPTLQEALRSSS